MLKKVFSGIAIAEGGIIPKCYGISYYLPDRDGVVCYPLILNKIVRLFRNSYWWIYFGISRVRKFSTLERIQSDSYLNGFSNGWDRGQQEIFTDIDRMLVGGGKNTEVYRKMLEKGQQQMASAIDKALELNSKEG